ncbi:MAG: prepilin-type N-terminal cleavage/methylation domain-containing protein, partial [Pirellulaceae bacterium]|nr:prepilin-type N-terminal cleavage/methylation domain-containing protein [Pirellulaceae bacterium]
MCHHKISRPIQLVETSRRTRRDGLTLIELLVVVAILVALVGITATTIRPLQEGRDIREAARSVNAFLAAAQARAMELGRPVGVWLKRMPNNPNLVLELYVAEVPSPYTGDDMISSASVHETNKNIVTLKNVSRPGTGTGNESYVNITKDDFIRFGYKGPFYRIIDYPTPSEDKP